MERRGRPDQWYKLREFENQFSFKGKRMDEGPPVKRGLGIDFKAVLKMLRIFAKEFRRKRNDEDN